MPFLFPAVAEDLSEKPVVDFTALAIKNGTHLWKQARVRLPVGNHRLLLAVRDNGDRTYLGVDNVQLDVCEYQGGVI